MGDQSPSLVGFRRKPTGAEHNVLTYRVGLSVHVLRRTLGSPSAMYPHPRKIVAEALFRTFPTYNEGQKSKIKANLVSTASLAEMAEQLGLGDHMILGRGEEKTGGRRKQALLADTCEALIAAIYLDGGLDPARNFLMREFAAGIDDAKGPEYFGRDHKSRLQERLQAQGRPLPSYRVSGEVGPDHRKMFHVGVFVGDELIAQGVGRTKKEAEQEGAKLALAGLGNNDNE